MRQFVFPKDFLWGAATSSHQVEGNNHNDWTEWEKKRGLVESGRACDHYNRFREDFDIAKQLGHNAHRFSIEWSRIEPEEGKFNEREIEHYRDVILALRERGMEPFVTLWHWTLPLWVRDKGGIASPEFANMFEPYAKRVADDFGDLASFWITINEPMIWTMNAFLRGIWPPQKKNALMYYRILRNLIAAHKAAYNIIKSARADARVGVAKNNIYFDGGIMRHAARWWWNYWFLNRIRHHQDFIGLNYYFHNRTKGFLFNQNENKEVSDMGWEIYPEGLFHILCDLKKYDKPIYITENGIADAEDEKRARFIKDHLRWIAQAMQRGVDVHGYFYWSLLDNFEWEKGFEPRFGLVEMDYQTMARKIRPSAFVYRDVINAASTE